MFRLRAGYFPEKESSQSSPGLRARTQERRAVLLAIPAGAVPSGMVSKLTRCRSTQKHVQVLLQDKMRLSGATYTVGAGRRAGGDTRPYEILYPFFGGASPLGEFHKGGPQAPFWSF